jgi:hypothetical protein
VRWRATCIRVSVVGSMCLSPEFCDLLIQKPCRYFVKFKAPENVRGF